MGSLWRIVLNQGIRFSTRYRAVSYLVLNDSSKFYDSKQGLMKLVRPLYRPHLFATAIC